jgi:hypothetical protein
MNNIVKRRSVAFDIAEFIGRRRDNGRRDIHTREQEQRKTGEKQKDNHIFSVLE